jgi:hypothetical protein
MTMRDALVFMGLSPGCTQNDITAQYRRLARIYHPDAGGDTERFIQLQKARQVLLTGAKGYARPHTSPQPQANYNRHQTITDEELREIHRAAAVQEKITTIAIFLAIFLPVIILGFYSTPNILADLSAWYVANRADIFGIIFILAVFWIATREVGLYGIIGAVLLFVVPAVIYFIFYLPLAAELQHVFNQIEMATDAFRQISHALR